jgi:ATP-dependent phosphofructokinase / diphosphate-dependent phosphofructokinase
VIAVSEGLKLADGRYVCELSDDARYVDAFGHKNLTGTARYLSNLIARRLNVKTRCIELSTMQRCAGHLSSRTDVLEAYQVGGAGVKAAMEGQTGQMVILQRVSEDPYQAITGLCPVERVANFEKKLPDAWIDSMILTVTEDVVRYMRPLVQAELPAFYIDGLVRHLNLKFN